MIIPTMPNSTLRELVDELEDDVVAPELVKREAEQHREQQHLQDLARRERIADAGRNDVQDEVGDATERAGLRVLRDRRGIELRGVHVHARRPASRR